VSSSAPNPPRLRFASQIAFGKVDKEDSDAAQKLEQVEKMREAVKPNSNAATIVSTTGNAKFE
jgi:hypothetical protein